MVVLVLSTYSVTPYDLPSYLLIALAVLVAVGPRPRRPGTCAVVGVAAMCTRESAFLAAAAAVAFCWAVDRPPGWAGWRDRLQATGPEADRWRNAASLAASTTVTYVAVHLALAGGRPVSLWAGPGVGANVHDARELAGVVLAAAVIAVVWHGLSRVGGGPRPVAARRALWVLAVPYVAVSVVGGMWFEGPRLVAPILVCEYLLAVLSAPPPVRPSASASREAAAPAGR